MALRCEAISDNMAGLKISRASHFQKWIEGHSFNLLCNVSMGPILDSVSMLPAVVVPVNYTQCQVRNLLRHRQKKQKQKSVSKVKKR